MNGWFDFLIYTDIEIPVQEMLSETSFGEGSFIIESLENEDKEEKLAYHVVWKGRVSMEQKSTEQAISEMFSNVIFLSWRFEKNSSPKSVVQNKQVLLNQQTPFHLQPLLQNSHKSLDKFIYSNNVIAQVISGFLLKKKNLNKALEEIEKRKIAIEEEIRNYREYIIEDQDSPESVQTYLEEISELEAEIVYLNKKLQSVLDIKKQEIKFSKQTLSDIEQEINQSKKQHAIFANAIVKDGIFYASSHKEVSYQPTHTISCSVDACGLNKLSLCSPKTFNNLYKVWFDLPYEDRLSLHEKLGFYLEESNSYKTKDLSEIAQDIVIEVDSFDHKPTLEDIKKSLLKDEDLKMLAKEQYQELLTAYALLVEEVIQQSAYNKNYAPIFKSKDVVSVTSSVSAKDDNKIVQTLLAKGASIVDHKITLPAYNSWASINTGKALILEENGVRIEYVPHNIQYKTSEETFVMKLDWGKDKNKVKQKIEQYVADHGIPLEEILVRCQKKGEKFIPRIAYQIDPKDISEEEKVAFKSGKPYQAEKGDYYLTADKFGLKELQSVMFDRLIVNDKCIEDKNPLAVIHESIVQDYIEDKMYEFNPSPIKHVATCLKQGNEEFPSKFFKLQTLAEYKLIDDIVEFEEIPVGSRKSQEAPKSEVGNLKVTTVNLQKSIDSLKDINVIDELIEEIPWNILPGDKTHISVEHPDHYKTPTPILLPPGEAVIHGLTGCYVQDGQKEEVMSRLEKILQKGGLQSISLRRHTHNNIESLSPIGDIASGIDMGVPTSISKTSVYGEDIFFIMKPEILKRRDIWFSPRDYGSGHSREEEYNNYAKSINQKSYLHPCSKKSKERHFKKLKQDNNTENNEAYFRGAISLQEIDTIAVTYELETEIISLQNKGLLPKNIKVQFFEDEEDLQAIIQQYR